MARLWPGSAEFRGSTALTFRRAVAAGALAWLAACGARSSGPPAPLGDPCVFLSDPGRALLDTVRVVLAEPPLADGDSSTGDRFIARLLAPGAEEIDCRGVPHRPTDREAPYVVVPQQGEADTRLVRSGSARGPSSIEVRRARSNSDLRDQLDRGADLVFAIDAQTIQYAAQHPEFVLLPTGPRRAYYLVTIDGDRVDDPSAADRSDLAAHAVREAAVPLSEDRADAACPFTRADGGGQRRSVVAYPADDEVARQLAERVASLSGGVARPGWVAAMGPRVRAEPVASIAELRRIVARGEVAVVVVPGHSAATVGCLAPLGARVAPLVAVSGAVIVRRGVPPMRWLPGELVGFEPVTLP